MNIPVIVTHYKQPPEYRDFVGNMNHNGNIEYLKGKVVSFVNSTDIHTRLSRTFAIVILDGGQFVEVDLFNIKVDGSILLHD